MWPSWGLNCLRGFEIWGSNVWFCCSPHGPELTLWALLFTIPPCKMCYFAKQIQGIYSPRLFKSPPTASCYLTAGVNAGEHPTPEVFILHSVKLLSPEPIICFDCQGSELAQGGVAVLRGKTGVPLSCWPEGCWDGKPKPCGEISLWRRTMFKNDPLWAVYVVLNQHYSHLAGGKTNKAYKLKLKKHIITAVLLYYYQLLPVASCTK